MKIRAGGGMTGYDIDTVDVFAWISVDDDVYVVLRIKFSANVSEERFAEFNALMKELDGTFWRPVRGWIVPKGAVSDNWERIRELMSKTP